MKTLKSLFLVTFFALAGLVSASAVAQEAQPYSQAELDQMLAPIALYPDTVLSHVLIAATYPLEVVEAARWSRNNPGLSGQEAVDRVEDRDWDPSVKALVAFPELLDRMDRDIAWTQDLGNAFLAQEGEVTDSIQYLRNQAYDNGQLQSNQQVNVVRETRYIYIEPAQPQVVYVPYYDPRYVYGHWRWAAYPPVYWHHPPGFSVNLGFYWGVGFHIRSSFFFSSFYWPSRHVVVVDHHYHDRYRNYGYRKGHGHYRPAHHMAHYDGARRWKHSSDHRRGVSYRGSIDQDRFAHRDGGRNRDHSAPVRDVQTRERHRDWADQQRSRYVDNAERPLRGDRSRDRGGNDQGRDRSRTGNRDRSFAPGNDRDNAVANNTVRDGRQRSRDADSARRPAPLDAPRDNRGDDRSARADRAAGRNNGRGSDRAIEQLRRDLAEAGASRRADPQAAAPRGATRDTQRATPRNRQPQPDREVAESRGRRADPQAAAPRGATRDTQRATPRNRQPQPDRAVAESRDRRAAPARESRSNRGTSSTRREEASPRRETHYAAAAPQRSQRPDAARQPQARRQAEPPRQAPHARSQAQAARPDRAAAQRSARQEHAPRQPRSEPQRSAGKNERSRGDRGSRGGDRNSRD